MQVINFKWQPGHKWKFLCHKWMITTSDLVIYHNYDSLYDTELVRLPVVDLLVGNIEVPKTSLELQPFAL